MAKSTEFVFDRVLRRWRKGGKWAKPPRKRELRLDKAGRPIDAAGKRVPLEAIAPEPKRKPAKPSKRKPAKPSKRKTAKPKAKPKAKAAKPKAAKPSKPKAARPKRKPKKPDFDAPIPETVKVVPLRAEPIKAEYLPEGGELSPRQIMSSYFDNRNAPDKAGQALFNVVGKISTTTPLNADDITLYRFGVQFQTTRGAAKIGDMQTLARSLSAQYPELSVKYGEKSLFLLLGKDGEPVDRRAAMESMQRYSTVFTEAWGRLMTLWDGDLGWFVFAENDEVSY